MNKVYEFSKREALKYKLDILFLNENELIPLNTIGDESPGDRCFKCNYKNKNVVFKMEGHSYPRDESEISEVVKHIALRSKIDIDGIVKIFPVVVVLKCIKKGEIGFGIIMEKVEGNQPYDICLIDDYETRMEIKKQLLESLEELFNKYKLSWFDQWIKNILWNSKTRRVTIIDPVFIPATNTYNTEIKDIMNKPRKHIPKVEWHNIVNLKNSRPVPNKSVYDFIVSEIKNTNLYDLDQIPEFCENYTNWIQSTKLNNLIGLENFNSKQYVHGTTQAFDFFYLTNPRKRMRCFKGDFVYHRLSWQQERGMRRKFDWSYIEDDIIRKNDAVIMSVPFSDLGDVHPRTNEILDKCDELGVPVFLDCAYMIIARDIDFDFNRECIQGVSFSMSKGFYGAEKLRIGLRLTREYKDDPVEVFNSMQMLNTVGVHVGQKLIDNYSVDYNNEMYRDKQITICKDLEIEPSKCVLFGIADENHTEFGKHDRGTEWRRVCISPLFGDMKDLHYG
mgnify:FL=1